VTQSALRVIGALKREKAPITALHWAIAADVHVTTIHRLLPGLRKEGLAEPCGSLPPLKHGAGGIGGYLWKFPNNF